jgi:hypothetical protein
VIHRSSDRSRVKLRAVIVILLLYRAISAFVDFILSLSLSLSERKEAALHAFRFMHLRNAGAIVR